MATNRRVSDASPTTRKHQTHPSADQFDDEAEDGQTQVGTGHRTLVVGCAALVRELRQVLGQLTTDAMAADPSGDVGASDRAGDRASDRAGDRATFDLELLPAPLHNRPERIPGRVEAILRERAAGYDRVVVAYGDCGTGGLLEPVLERYGATRISGAHCYEFFAGATMFAALQQDEPGTFYLTDFLARHFHALVWSGLGLDRHPELRDQYFGNYRRVVLLSQSDDVDLVEIGRRAAGQLGLAFEHRPVGLAPFAEALTALVLAPARPLG